MLFVVTFATACLIFDNCTELSAIETVWVEVPELTDSLNSIISFSTILPEGPVPLISARLIPFSLASLFATGLAFTVRGFDSDIFFDSDCISTDFEVGFSSGVDSLLESSDKNADISSDFSPITAMIVPTGTTSPSETTIFLTRPLAKDSNSTTALSVWISARSSPLLICSPSFFKSNSPNSTPL